MKSFIYSMLFLFCLISLPLISETAPLTGQTLAHYEQQLDGDWNVINEHHLEKVYLFNDFLEALAFTNEIGAIAEQEGHHPDILLTYGKVKIQLWTHTANGLSEKDFILAVKIDAVFKQNSKG